MTHTEHRPARPERDIWQRWRAPGRATSWEIIRHVGGSYWLARNPDLTLEDLPEAEWTLRDDDLPEGVLPLMPGQILPCTMRRLNGEFGGFFILWSPYRFEA